MNKKKIFLFLLIVIGVYSISYYVREKIKGTKIWKQYETRSCKFFYRKSAQPSTSFFKIVENKASVYYDGKEKFRIFLLPAKTTSQFSIIGENIVGTEKGDIQEKFFKKIVNMRKKRKKFSKYREKI